jgi:thiamine monophosphate synthase
MGVTEFYRHQDDYGAERLAVIAAVTLPITSLSSVVGMNVIVNDQTHWGVAQPAAVDHVGGQDRATQKEQCAMAARHL